MRMTIQRCALTACWLIFGCAPAPVVPTEELPAIEFNTNFERLPPLLKTVGAGELSLYEGLPSEFWEPQLREQELRSKQIVKYLGHPFYQAKVPLTDADAMLLTELLTNTSSFRAYRPQKPGSGFHADYCLEWTLNGATTQMIISLENAEIVLSGADGNVKCDLVTEPAEKLKSLLDSYQNHRPIPQIEPSLGK